MLGRRGWMIGAGAFVGARGAYAAEPLEVLSADIRPLSIADGPRRGITLDVVRDALKAAGREVRFTFLPFAEVLQKGQERPGALLAPIGRSPQREANYTWIAKVLDVPQAMGTLRGKPTVDLAGARKLAKVGVIKTGVQETYLRDQGLTNLVTFGTPREIAQALADGQVDAWYATATEIVLNFEAIGKKRGVQIGPTVVAVPAWLAANKDTGTLPVEAIRAAIEAMDRSGAIQAIYKEYVQA